MPAKTILGLDHVVVTVRDLNGAAEAWRRLGFTVSPRGTHSAHMGSGNYTIMLDPDYIELLGVLTPTPHNAPTRDFLDRHGDGIERAAFTTTDAAAGVEDLRARGFAAAIGPTDFGRPVTLPSGGQSEARFRTFQWPVDERPGGLRIFACQHLTREAVWIPELMRHANTARRLARVEIVTPDPDAAAGDMARLIGGEARPETDGAVRVPSGPGRADFVFRTRHGLAARYPGVPLEGVREESVAGLALVAGDLEAAARAIGGAASRSEQALVVPPGAATGIMLAFEGG